MTNSSASIVILGGANSDYLVQGERLPQAGQTIDGSTFTHGPGGKGANQAVGVARLGARAVFIGMVGLDDRGEALARAMQREGVDTSHLYRTASAPTGAALIMVDDHGQKQIMTAPGSNRLLTAGHVRRAAEVIGAADVLLLQFECPMEAVLEAVRLARDAGVKVVLDPAPPVAPGDLPPELLQMIDLLKPNGHEAKALTGQKVDDQATARKAARMLLNRGVGAVVVQAGDEGNLAVWSGGEQFMPNLDVKSVDATGAGDAFAAAMAVALAEGQPMEHVARFGHAAAAFATTRLGAQAGLPRRHELDPLI